MSNSMNIVIIDPDAGAMASLAKHIKAFDRSLVLSGSARSLDEGYQLIVKTRPTLVILDIDTSPDAAFEMVKNVLLHYPGTVIFATSAIASSDNILRAMRNGCSEFLLRPVDQTDLYNALKKVGRFFVKPASYRSANGKVITVFSPKGGVGASTVAVNLAVALHQGMGEQVVLVDLDLEAGDADMFLNLRTKYTISDVTSNIARLDRAFLEGVLARHSSGIYLLAEPANVEEAESITASQVREVIDLLKSMFSYVVIDTNMGYGDINLAAFDSSDMVYLVGVLSLPSIRNMQKALDVFGRLGYGPDKVKLLINRYLRKSEISIEDAQKTLNYEVAWNLPNDYNDVMTSINRGLPLNLLAPHSEISRSFRDLAKMSHDHLEEMARKGAAAEFAPH